MCEIAFDIEKVNSNYFKFSEGLFLHTANRKETKAKPKYDGVEGGTVRPVPHLPLLLVGHPCLSAPQCVHLLAAWLLASPHL